MAESRYTDGIWLGIVVLFLSFSAEVAVSQETDEEAAESETADEVVQDDLVIDEVVVIAPWPDGPMRLDPLYEGPLRARIRRELDLLLQDREESKWRAEFTDEQPSRIEFGYDPRDEYRLRNEMDLTPPPSETTKPATVIRIGF